MYTRRSPYDDMTPAQRWWRDLEYMHDFFEIIHPVHFVRAPLMIFIAGVYAYFDTGGVSIPFSSEFLVSWMIAYAIMAAIWVVIRTFVFQTKEIHFNIAGLDNGGHPLSHIQMVLIHFAIGFFGYGVFSQLGIAFLIATSLMGVVMLVFGFFTAIWELLGNL